MVDSATVRTVHDLITTVLNEQRYGAVPDYCHDDVIMHRPGGVDERGVEAYVAHYRRLHTAFPDFTATLVDSIAEDDRVAVRLRLRGTHEGTLFGLAPTGTMVSFSAHILYRFRETRIAEEWHESDRLALRRQLEEQ